MAKVGAIILGGGTITEPTFREAAGVDCKSLIDLRGRPMIQWVAEALKASGAIGSVAAVGPECLRDSGLSEVADYILPDRGHEVDNLLSGMDALPDAEHIMMVSSDTPLLTPESVDDLVLNAPVADIVYPSVEKAEVMAQFGERKWVFVRTHEGEFTGSSTVLFRPSAFRDHEDTLRKVFDARRDVMALVRMWGVGFALKFAMGQLSLRDVEKKISETLNVDGRSYVSAYAELAFDVDKPSDITLAEKCLGGRG